MAVEFKNYYLVLDVTPKATDVEIKRAFRALARKHHPDLAKDKKSAEEKFKEINEAKEVLSNPESRRQFDLFGADWKSGSRPPPGWCRGQPPARGTRVGAEKSAFKNARFGDLFKQIFGGRADQSREGSPCDAEEFSNGQQQPRAAVRGQDLKGDILITRNEVLKGALREISVRRNNARTGQEETETYPVPIPKGVQAGQLICLTGKGGDGLNGGSAGDIYLRVCHAQHPD